MNCAHVKDELMLWFGQPRLPDELIDHLRQCRSCRAFWEESVAVSERLDQDSLFYPEPDETDRLVNSVMASLDARRPRDISVVSRLVSLWHRHVPVAAAAVLVLGIGIGIFLAGGTAFQTNLPESTAGVIEVAGIYDDDDAELDDNTVSALIEELTWQHRSEASQWLLDDLTEEELQYLEKSFNVGDLL
ncbi:MAG: hypothetical protein ABII79_14725 [bacterium]